jgi:catechol 2,3-dioxygenase-like lactoylglutathione lyase family enzyme
VREVLRKLDIVVMRVRDWPGAVRWYAETLGLRTLYREDDHQWCQFALPEGGANLALHGVEFGEPGGRSRCVPNIRVVDLDGTVETLRQRGVRILGFQDHAEEGYRLATIADPEGNELQLYELVQAAG